ncbi:MAG: hypothetical protein JRJ37_06665 [Deltaproteobacteria bacterium]|nr:hypothetical protein [Deltaproteobacteria bacterium]MBW2368021.1 hypothetical protein [Deltaproteobacteria bacterium]
MSIQPTGEALRRAVKYLSEKRLEDPQVNMVRLIDEACLKFDLTPKEGDYLIKFYKEEE